MNWTPEYYLAHSLVMQPKKCGWCVSAHVANIECSCEEACTSSWCPLAGGLELGMI